VRKFYQALGLCAFVTGLNLFSALPSSEAAPQTTTISSTNTVYQRWHDNRRGRDIPVKIYLPTSGNHPQAQKWLDSYAVTKYLGRAAAFERK